VTWALDNKTVFYTKQDPGTLRSYQIWRHVLGTPVADDVLVYQEDDDTFSCRVWRTKSDAYLVISSYQTLSTEYRILEADKPEGEFRIFQARMPDLEYSIDHQGDRFLIRTNLHATNFRLMECPLDRTGLVAWQEVIPHRQDVLLEGVEVFRDWIVAEERYDGLSHLRIIPGDGSADHTLEFQDPTWSAWTSLQPADGHRRSCASATPP
jgi:oligopeptidase B